MERQRERERISEEGGKKGGWGGVRGTLARLAAPALTSQRRACSLPSTSPPLALCAPQPLLHYSPNPSTPSPFALCRSTGLQLPAWLSAWGPSVQESMCVNISLCVCVSGRRGSWSHACLSYSAFSLFFFLFLSHGLEQPSVA